MINFKSIINYLAIIIFTLFAINANAQTKEKLETIELKTSNPDIVIKVTRDGRILETKAFNNSNSKSFQLDYSIKVTLKSKTKTFSQILKGSSSNENFPLKPKEYSYLTTSELLPAADDEVRYIRGTEIREKPDQSLYHTLISAELVSFSSKPLSK
jgi:hypothetical protein